MTAWEKLKAYENTLSSITSKYKRQEREINYGNQSTNNYKYEYEDIRGNFQSYASKFLFSIDEHTEENLKEIISMDLNDSNMEMAKGLYSNVAEVSDRIDGEESIHIVFEESLETKVSKLESKKIECENIILMIKDRMKEIDDEIDVLNAKI